MNKKKIDIEYTMNTTSGKMLWEVISSPIYLSEWFADEVQFDDEIATFRWGKNEIREADIIKVRPCSCIRFKWRDDELEDSYFEMKINHTELTDDYILSVVDFAEEGETDDLISLWDTQMSNLRRKYGF
ncbi:MAG: START-like domain-containing protein [Bacteroides sp.]|nr:START-like domain-containing protein [Bacteroides sp.]